jgi:hypothetical protein
MTVLSAVAGAALALGARAVLVRALAAIRNRPSPWALTRAACVALVWRRRPRGLPSQLLRPPRDLPVAVSPRGGWL